MAPMEAAMTETLRRVVAQIEQLPPEQQDALAEIMFRELEEQEWDALVAKPGSQRFLARLATEARREDAAPGRGGRREHTEHEDRAAREHDAGRDAAREAGLA
jgi:hypothetical protein